MIIRNLKYYHDLPFSDYLALPGKSYSGIKGFQGTPNAGMSLGTLVHNYILEPNAYSWEDAGMVKKIAEALRKYLGAALTVLDKEIAFTCDMEYNGMLLRYKGRADLIRAGRIVVDLKILGGGLQPAIDRFGYNNQLSGYCLATDSPMALIIAYNKQRSIVETKIIKPVEDFWNYQIVSFGEPIKTAA